ncbi:unnamed protein product, partial [Polarella glacialis]
MDRPPGWDSIGTRPPRTPRFLPAATSNSKESWRHRVDGLGTGPSVKRSPRAPAAAAAASSPRAPATPEQTLPWVSPPLVAPQEMAATLASVCQIQAGLHLEPWQLSRPNTSSAFQEASLGGLASFSRTGSSWGSRPGSQAHPLRLRTPRVLASREGGGGRFALAPLLASDSRGYGSLEQLLSPGWSQLSELELGLNTTNNTSNNNNNSNNNSNNNMDPTSWLPQAGAEEPEQSHSSSPARANSKGRSLAKQPSTTASFGSAAGRSPQKQGSMVLASRGSQVLESKDSQVSLRQDSKGSSQVLQSRKSLKELMVKAASSAALEDTAAPLDAAERSLKKASTIHTNWTSALMSSKDKEFENVIRENEDDEMEGTAEEEVVDGGRNTERDAKPDDSPDPILPGTFHARPETVPMTRPRPTFAAKLRRLEKELLHQDNKQQRGLHGAFQFVPLQEFPEDPSSKAKDSKEGVDPNSSKKGKDKATWGAYEAERDVAQLTWDDPELLASRLQYDAWRARVVECARTLQATLIAFFFAALSQGWMERLLVEVEEALMRIFAQVRIVARADTLAALLAAPSVQGCLYGKGVSGSCPVGGLAPPTRGPAGSRMAGDQRLAGHEELNLEHRDPSDNEDQFDVDDQELDFLERRRGSVTSTVSEQQERRGSVQSVFSEDIRRGSYASIMTAASDYDERHRATPSTANHAGFGPCSHGGVGFDGPRRVYPSSSSCSPSNVPPQYGSQPSGVQFPPQASQWPGGAGLQPGGAQWSPPGHAPQRHQLQDPSVYNNHAPPISPHLHMYLNQLGGPALHPSYQPPYNPGSPYGHCPSVASNSWDTSRWDPTRGSQPASPLNMPSPINIPMQGSYQYSSGHGSPVSGMAAGVGGYPP